MGDVAALKSPDKPNVQKQNWLFSFTLESKTRSSSQLYQVDVLLAMPEGDVRTLTTPKDGEVE